jgi:hypothetical protein
MGFDYDKHTVWVLIMINIQYGLKWFIPFHF